MTGRRRTQDERSAHTRRRLHEATIASLIEVGYANTSTAGIAERAGVSRGAQTHHYPGKLSLIVAATEHMFDGFALGLELLAKQLRDGDLTFEQYLDAFWDEMLHGTWFYASLEIIVAARGDPELREKLEPLILALHERFEAIWTETFVAVAPDEIDATTVLNLVMNVFRGMAVQAVLRPDRAYYVTLLGALKQMLRAHIRPLPQGES